MTLSIKYWCPIIDKYKVKKYTGGKYLTYYNPKDKEIRNVAINNVAININAIDRDDIADSIYYDKSEYFHDFQLQDLFKVIPYYNELDNERKELLRLAIEQCIKEESY